MLSERQKKILAYIVDADRLVLGKEICSELDISLRTLQNEIRAINQELPLILSSNKGYSIDYEQYEDLEEDRLPQNETLEFLKVIMSNEGKVHIEDLANAFYMSTSSVEKKLKEISRMLAKYQLILKREHAYVWIEGEEVDKRACIKDNILDELEPVFSSLDNLNFFFPDINIEDIEEVVFKAINHFHCRIEDLYVNSLMVNIVIALSRMLAHNYMGKKEEDHLEKDTAYQIAEEICLQYSVHHAIHPGYQDIEYIASLLRGQIKAENADESIQRRSLLDAEFMQSIDTILKDAFGFYLLDIDYSEYLYNFALHIQQLILRSNNKQTATNEYQHALKKQFPFIYDVAVKISKDIADVYHIEIADAEISLIAIHIGFVLEDALNKYDKVNIILYCDEYHQIANKIKNEIMKFYGDVVNLQQIQRLKVNDNKTIFSTCDLVITTKDLYNVNKRILKITPFYTLEDNRRIGEAIHGILENKQSKYTSQLFEKYFHQDLFFIQDDFKDKYEVIDFLGGQIVVKGIDDETFIESVKNREKMSSTCFIDTFAIPHAITMDSKRTACCVLLSRKGIEWDETKIHIVLMIAVCKNDRKEFMNIYEGILKVLENKNKIKELLKVETYEEFIDAMKSGH